MSVAGFVLGKMKAAEDLFFGMLQRWLQRHAFRRAFHALVASRRLQVARLGEELQDAARHLVVVNAGRLAQRAQAIAAVGGESRQRAAVALEAARRALAQETQAPGP